MFNARTKVRVPSYTRSTGTVGFTTYKSSAITEMGDRLATTDTGRKVGDCCPFWVGNLVPHLTQCGLGRGLPPYQVAS